MDEIVKKIKICVKCRIQLNPSIDGCPNCGAKIELIKIAKPIGSAVDWKKYTHQHQKYFGGMNQ